MLGHQKYLPTHPMRTEMHGGEMQACLLDPFGFLRHPSQLYESFGEGLLLFILLFLINKFTKIHGIVCSSFLILYGAIRFIIEFYRQPDAHIGYVALEFMSMGQLLCIPMMIIGFILLAYSRNKT